MSLLAPEEPRRQQEQAVQEIMSSVQERLLQLVREGTNITALGPATDVARDMVRTLATVKSPWADIVGPCYTSGALQRELGIGRSAISKAVNENRILRVTTSDKVTLYPAFQVRDGALVPGLGRVLRVLSGGTSSTWTWAQWLNGQIRGANGETLPRNIDRLAAGDIDGVLHDAEQDAAAWAA